MRIRADWGERQSVKQQAAYQAGVEIKIDREAINLKSQFAHDPEGLDNAWKAFTEATLSEVETWAVTPVQEYLGRRGNEAYSSVLNQKVTRDDQLANEALTAKRKAADDDVLGLAMSGAIGTPEYERAYENYRSVLDVGVTTGAWSLDEALLAEEDLSARATGETASLTALQIEKDKGFAAAVDFIRSEILENDKLSLSPGQRRTTFNHALSSLNL
jgi:hypothetical protein